MSNLLKRLRTTARGYQFWNIVYYICFEKQKLTVVDGAFEFWLADRAAQLIH